MEDNQDLLISSRKTPHCQNHGAMMLLNGYWRCYGTYKGNWEGHVGKGVIPKKFIERTCPTTITDEEWEGKQ